MFHLGYDRKDLALRVTVSNTGGDGAYEAKLLAKFPSVLSYSGLRFPTGVRATYDTLVPPCGCSAHLPQPNSERLSLVDQFYNVLTSCTYGPRRGTSALCDVTKGMLIVDQAEEVAEWLLLESKSKLSVGQ